MEHANRCMVDTKIRKQLCCCRPINLDPHGIEVDLSKGTELLRGIKVTSQRKVLTVYPTQVLKVLNWR